MFKNFTICCILKGVTNRKVYKVGLCIYFMKLDDLVNDVVKYLSASQNLNTNQRYGAYNRVLDNAPDDDTRGVLRERYGRELEVVQGEQDSVLRIRSQDAILEKMAEGYTSVLSKIGDGELQQKAYELAERTPEIEKLRNAVSSDRPDVAGVKKVIGDIYKGNVMYDVLRFTPEEVVGLAHSKIERDIVEFSKENLIKKSGKDIGAFSAQKAKRFIGNKIEGMEEGDRKSIYMDLATSYAISNSSR